MTDSIEEVKLPPLVLNPPPNVIRVLDATGLEKLQDFFNRCGKQCGWDCETTPVRDYFYRRLRTIQFGNSDEQYVIDLREFCHDNPALTASDDLYQSQGYYGANLNKGLQLIKSMIEPVLTDPTFLKVGVNLSFEYTCMYWLLGIRACGFWDCSVVERIIYAGFHSLKDYSFYSMGSMFGRYFGKSIDKSLQESFNLEDDLTDEQCEYAALDTRTPLGIMGIQRLVVSGQTVNSLRNTGKVTLSKYLEHIDPLLLGDDLTEVVQIENDCIGSFQDMHIHGERFDRERWQRRVDKCKVEFRNLVDNVLDPIFIPLVGLKTDIITEEQIQEKTAEWKAHNNIPAEETELKGKIRLAKKNNDLNEFEFLTAKLTELEAQRKTVKEVIKKEASELGKRRTKINKLVSECEGLAIINYSSDAQLKKCLRENFPKLANLESLDDDTLEEYKHIPVMDAIRKYHGLAKEINTYGDAWTREWITKSGNDEGWLHPGDGRLHGTYNQLDTETGRSSSSSPNLQNLPQGEEVRSCFIADPPDESIRISNCCDADTEEKFNNANGGYVCIKCRLMCETHAEDYVDITADMSGAELRIIAEDSNDEGWIGAFLRDEDVHSVGASMMYSDEWPKWALPNCKFYELHTEESVAKNPNCTIGQPKKQKCKCPEHADKRNIAKAPNFLLAYGGGPLALAPKIGKTVKEAKVIMSLHERNNPNIWAYLDQSGKKARMQRKAFDLFGRRRVFPAQTREMATERAIEYGSDRLELDIEKQTENIQSFVAVNGRSPNSEEKYALTHRPPNDREITKQVIAMESGIERKGKNHRIQGTNATIAKLSFSCGFDSDGKPYLWWLLPRYKAKLVKFVHDEVVIQAPRRFAKIIADLVGDSFKRAARTKMHKVTMEFEFNIAEYWAK